MLRPAIGTGMTPEFLWLSRAACILGFGVCWLLPNHYPPWPSFHSEAAVGAVTLAAGLILLCRHQRLDRMPATAGVIGLLGFLPWIQHAGGLVHFQGSAWITSLHIWALSGSIWIGYSFARNNHVAFLNWLFASLFLASILTTGIQFMQWFGLTQDLDLLELWVSDLQDRSRAYGNLNQPNHAAILHVLALIGLVWQFHRHTFGRLVIGIALPWTCLGIILTSSRVGLLALVLVTLASLVYKRGLGWKTPGLFLAALATCLLLKIGIQEFNAAFNLHSPLALSAHIAKDTRLHDWGLFLQAAAARPWAGYGFGQITLAQLIPDGFEMLDRVGVFAHTHNMLLDLAIMGGIPFALTGSALIAHWLWRSTPRSGGQSTPIFVFLALLPIGLHANVELPHFHAYFLLLAGLLIGCAEGLSPSLRQRLWKSTPRLFGVVWTSLAVMWGLTVVDYLKVEEDFTILRFELQHIGHPPPEIPGFHMAVLDQLHAQILYVRYQPAERAAPQDILRAEQITQLHPSAGNILKLAVLYGLNQRPDDARRWLRKSCISIQQDLCAQIGQEWKRRQGQHPSLKPIAWPYPGKLPLP